MRSMLHITRGLRVYSEMAFLRVVPSSIDPALLGLFPLSLVPSSSLPKNPNTRFPPTRLDHRGHCSTVIIFTLVPLVSLRKNSYPACQFSTFPPKLPRTTIPSPPLRDQASTSANFLGRNGFGRYYVAQSSSQEKGILRRGIAHTGSTVDHVNLVRVLVCSPKRYLCSHLYPAKSQQLTGTSSRSGYVRS
ncbi:hypothetical protein BU26DRAFT_270561 [Trematosphaeria pertusa]|uniref:Uncharacterized protein n=1 Tax=Trematosphaeria pertusa TaxID=390896 RepID=A0A6A6IKW5_9PLEO|nr:uncharacterized protein BU26DRAFT_270561 [Trematosphaeria pertusa]KAF2250837.1 hypothetical protein BU26DRAFT_270561 [Trematosphaeria pertusa]